MFNDITYKVIREIDSGQFGTVYEIYDNDNKFALKKFKLSSKFHYIFNINNIFMTIQFFKNTKNALIQNTYYERSKHSPR